MSEEEIQFFSENTGEYIQMEGFLSTSLSRDTAERFINNAFLEIKVEEGERRYGDHGFVDITEFSVYQNEKEILFNCMNTFRIEGGQKERINKQDVDVFRLRYVSMVGLKESMGRGTAVGERELKMIENYDYQQKQAGSSQADLLYQLEEWGEAAKQARRQLYQLQLRRNREQLAFHQEQNLPFFRQHLPLQRIRWQSI